MLTYEYDYDENGNRVAYAGPEGTASATYDAQDRLLTYGGNSYAYNDHGQLVTKTYPVGVESYEYDELGNLLSVTLPDSTLIEYVIDALGRRVGKKVNGTLVREWTYQDALNPVAEYDGSGNLIQQFVYATRMNVPDLIIRGGTTYRVIADQVGSVRRIVEVSTGAVAQELTYSPFGKVLSDSSPGWQPFAYAGGLYDNDTKLVRFGARDYDAEVGRWTAKDPSGFGGGANLFAYSYSNPVNYIDATGNHPAAVIVIAGLLLAGNQSSVASSSHANPTLSGPSSDEATLGIVKDGAIAAGIGTVLLGAAAGIRALLALRSGSGGFSSVIHASQVGTLGAEEGTLVLGHYSRPISTEFGCGMQETLPILEEAASQLGGKTLSSLPKNMSAISPEIHSANRIVFYTSEGMTGTTAAEMELIQSSSDLMSKTTFVYGGF